MNRSQICSVHPKMSLEKIDSFLSGFHDQVSVEEALCKKNSLIDVQVWKTEYLKLFMNLTETIHLRMS